ncbi:HNH endonuclease [Cronobacter dublinensis]|nr:HNH endonuclease [Cronobacter dublinensis]
MIESATFCLIAIAKPDQKTGLTYIGTADTRASKGGANYDLNTWHHHENGVTMMEVPKDIHERFRHRGGVSAIKRKLNCKAQE